MITNNKIDLGIIKKGKSRHITSGHVMWVSISIFFLLLVLVFFDLIKPSMFVNFVILVTAIVPIGTNIYGNSEYFPQDFEVLSKLTLLPDSIRAGDKNVPIDSLEALDIIVSDWFGKKVVFNVRAYGSGPRLSRGVNNYLKLRFKDKTEEMVQFQIQSEEQFRELSALIKGWYSKGIKIYEEYDHQRSYGLQHLTYAEVQDFKAKFQNNNISD